MTFELAFLERILLAVFAALPLTLAITLAACAGAAVLGFLLEIMRRSNIVLGLLVRFAIDALRSTPVLVQIYFLYFVLPFYGIVLPGPVIGVLALSLYYASYLAEVFKAGIDAVPRGQFEAAKALGLRPIQAILRVIAPQMLRNIAGPMGNYFISILKTTPTLAVIGVAEMMGLTLEIASDSVRYAMPMIVLGLVFFIIAATLAYLVRRLELRLLQPTYSRMEFTPRS